MDNGVNDVLLMIVIGLLLLPVIPNIVLNFREWMLKKLDVLLNAIVDDIVKWRENHGC